MHVSVQAIFLKGIQKFDSHSIIKRRELPFFLREIENIKLGGQGRLCVCFCYKLLTDYYSSCIYFVMLQNFSEPNLFYFIIFYRSATNFSQIIIGLYIFKLLHNFSEPNSFYFIIFLQIQYIANRDGRKSYLMMVTVYERKNS